MPAKSTILIILLLAAVALMARPPKDNKKKQYYPISYTSTYGNPTAQNSYTLEWYYDKEGRLIRDSMIYDYGGQSAQNFKSGESFTYLPDSVMWVNSNADTSYTRLTASGLPMTETLPFGYFSHAYYKPNGELYKQEIAQAVVNKRGQIEYNTTIADSVVYAKANIVSFSFKYPYIYKGLNNDSSFFVHCSYYDYNICAMDFYPIMRLKGLIDNQMSQAGGLDPAIFSKHLVKSIETPTFRLSFKYVIDEEGKVIGIDREWIYNNSPIGYTMSDHATIKYAYR